MPTARVGKLTVDVPGSTTPDSDARSQFMPAVQIPASDALIFAREGLGLKLVSAESSGSEWALASGNGLVGHGVCWSDGNRIPKHTPFSTRAADR